MRGFLLDSNVVSEINRLEPDARVLSFLSGETDLWLSVVVLHELEFGIRRLDPGQRRDRMRRGFSNYVAGFAHRILPVGHEEAVLAAALRVQARRDGRVLHLADALIAGTARAHDLAVATRNVRDFEGLDVEVFDPWAAS